PEDTIFQSILVAGVQGSGKTNFTKLLVQSLASRTDVSMIILDAEGEYKNFAKIANMPDESKHFLQSHGIRDVDYRILKLSNDIFQATATLSVQGINLTDVLQLLPDLEPKSSDILASITHRAYETLNESNSELNWKNLKDEIL